MNPFSQSRNRRLASMYLLHVSWFRWSYNNTRNDSIKDKKKNGTRPILETDLKRERSKRQKEKKETTKGESGEHHNSISEYYVSITLRSDEGARREEKKDKNSSWRFTGDERITVYTFFTPLRGTAKCCAGCSPDSRLRREKGVVDDTSMSRWESRRIPKDKCDNFDALVW